MYGHIDYKLISILLSYIGSKLFERIIKQRIRSHRDIEGKMIAYLK